MFFGDVQAALAVFGDDGFVAVFFEIEFDELEKIGLIVDDENGAFVRGGHNLPRTMIGKLFADGSWLPDDLGSAKDGAGGEGELHLGALIFDDLLDFGKLGASQLSLGVENIC